MSNVGILAIVSAGAGARGRGGGRTRVTSRRRGAPRLAEGRARGAGERRGRGCGAHAPQHASSQGDPRLAKQVFCVAHDTVLRSFHF